MLSYVKNFNYSNVYYYYFYENIYSVLIQFYQLFNFFCKKFLKVPVFLCIMPWL